MSAGKAVLLMAYGTPDTLDQVGEYFAHIRGGRQPSAEAIANLRARYERIGGTTPLLRVTRELASRSSPHWQPIASLISRETSSPKSTAPP